MNYCKDCAYWIPNYSLLSKNGKVKWGKCTHPASKSKEDKYGFQGACKKRFVKGETVEKLNVRITRCYLVEVVNKEGYVQDYYKDGSCHEASDYCFGTKEDAEIVGSELIKEIQESEDWK